MKKIPHPTDAMQVSFALEIPVNPNPLDLMGGFSKMRLERNKNGV